MFYWTIIANAPNTQTSYLHMNKQHLRKKVSVHHAKIDRKSTLLNRHCGPVASHLRSLIRWSLVLIRKTYFPTGILHCCPPLPSRLLLPIFLLSLFPISHWGILSGSRKPWEWLMDSAPLGCPYAAVKSSNLPSLSRAILHMSYPKEDPTCTHPICFLISPSKGHPSHGQANTRAIQRSKRAPE